MFGGSALRELLKILDPALQILDLLAEASWKSDRANVSRVTYQRLPRFENLSRTAAMSVG